MKKRIGPYQRVDGHRSTTRWGRMANSRAQDVLDARAKRLEAQMNIKRKSK